MLKEVSRYQISDREAVILKDKQGYCLRLFEGQQLIKDVDVRLHTLQYAEDCAENWVHRYGSFTGST